MKLGYFTHSHCWCTYDLKKIILILIFKVYVLNLLILKIGRLTILYVFIVNLVSYV